MGTDHGDRPSRAVLRYVARAASGRVRSVVAALTLAALPLWLARAHWRARWPWSGDAVSQVLPTALARRALANGRPPTWSPLYFQGESLLNPHSQLLYPPWWATLAPVPLPDALSLVLAAHFVAAALVAYLYARRAGLPVAVAWGIGAAAALPLAGLSGHHQKVLGWPWLVLLACQLLPREWANARRSGALVGLAGGALVLASSLYYAFYAAAFVAPLFALYRDRDRWLGALAGAAVGVPALALNVVPYLGAPRPPPGWWLTPWTALTGLVGLAPGPDRRVGGYLVSGVPFEGYAAVGAGVLVLAALGVRAGLRRDRRWAVGVAAGGGIGLALATLPFPYYVPPVDTFRTAGRANVLVALAALVFAVYACQELLDGRIGLPGWVQDTLADRRIPGTDRRIPGTEWRVPGTDRRVPAPTRRRALAAGLAALLALNAVAGAVAWERADPGTGTDLSESHEFAAGLPDDCEAVWAETYQDGESIPRGHLGMALLSAGYELDAVYYAAIGPSYRVRESDGDVAFDLLITPARVEGETALTGGSAGRVRGRVRRAELRHLGAREYRGDTLHLYAVRGACGGGRER